MAPFSCAQLDDVVAELALDLLAGDERAEAIAHVEGCWRCRRTLFEHSAAADRLIQLAPAGDPSVGFEERVLAIVAPAAQQANRLPRRRFVLIAAVAAVVALLASLGALVAVGRSEKAEIEAAMLAPDGANVGDVYVHEGSPAWIVVAVPAWAQKWGGVPYTVRVTGRDGSVHDSPGGDLAAGEGTWGTALVIAADQVRSVSLLGPEGTTWCTGTFSA
ncbi:MAG: hypothetical protein ACR2LQ_00540 [Acidimicrobiales bacterium]